MLGDAIAGLLTVYSMLEGMDAPLCGQDVSMIYYTFIGGWINFVALPTAEV